MNTLEKQKEFGQILIERFGGIKGGIKPDQIKSHYTIINVDLDNSRLFFYIPEEEGCDDLILIGHSPSFKTEESYVKVLESYVNVSNIKIPADLNRLIIDNLDIIHLPDWF